jgi:xanthine dehydrogenase YagR molybdenum-binding subunit
MSESIIGARPRRVDGRLKVSGAAQYAADHHPTDMVYAYGVFSAIASGRITAIDTAAAQKTPGVIEIFHHGHFSRLFRNPKTEFSPQDVANGVKVDESRLPFEDDRVYYAGQFVALVVADTFEHAREAAYKVKVAYAKDKTVANIAQSLQVKDAKASPKKYEHGDPEAAFSKAAHRIDGIYTTPVETHNPMEMHATTASWKDGALHLYEATQGVVIHRNTLARIFGLSPDRVTVEAPFIGSGFGSKLWAWPHSIACCAASREVGRPVQLVVPRSMMFTTTGHRPETRQHVKLATDTRGKLISVQHDSINSTSFTDTYVENCGGMTQGGYSCANMRVTHKTAQVNHGTPTSMRAPGAAPGLFALESAIDEMAIAAGMDPLAFRRLNFAGTDESKGLPWSSNHLLDAYDQAAKAFDWDRRNPRVGSMREGNEIIGYGLAACSWDAMRTPADARVSLRADGTAYVTCGVQDIGTGTYTIAAQAVASVTGLPMDKIVVKLGDSSFPPGPISGGSWATASVMPAIAQATREALDQLKSFATSEDGSFAGVSPDVLKVEGGMLKHGGRALSFAQILQAQRVASAEGQAHATPDKEKKASFRSFGVHMVEVRWDPGISHLRVARVVSAIDVGRAINSKTASNQVEGAIVMGIGMALFEATEYDERNAMPVNNNYAEYVVPVHADQPQVEVILLDYPDYKLNEFGARGVGEIGITGVAAAVANAVYHATGKRIRNLPITLDKLMDGAPAMQA